MIVRTIVRTIDRFFCPSNKGIIPGRSSTSRTYR